MRGQSTVENPPRPRPIRKSFRSVQHRFCPGAGPADGPCISVTAEMLCSAPPTPGGVAVISVSDDFISPLEAWDRVAKILFPDEEVTFVTERDDWLIDRYLPPGEEYYFPGDVRTRAPEALCAEVDRAYYRRSLEDRIVAWFQAKGFDFCTPRPLSRSVFEARLPVKSPKAAARRSIRREIPGFVRDYRRSTTSPTLTGKDGVRAAWKKIHGDSDREALDAEYRKQAGQPLRRGPRSKKPARK
jgi:hypothetical protein